MEKKYKAISIIVTQKPRTEYDSETREKRCVIIDTESGEIVDDAQGYGYKTAQKAYAGWSYNANSGETAQPFRMNGAPISVLTA